MQSHKKKKAFTLTELLVVVIVIGVLSAVVLPKFSKVVETRKTTEAEEMMAAVRAEQEKRCVLDKNYVNTPAQLASIMPTKKSKNFTYNLTPTGMKAQSEGKYKYQLEMPSYADGRLCCTNAAECAKLNKDYPLCDDLIARADYKSGAECAGEPEVKECSGVSTRACGCKNGGTQTRTCNTATGNWGNWSECSVPDLCNCEGESTQSCGCLGRGTQYRTCNMSTGSWNAWGSCSLSEACDCASVSGPKPEAASRACNSCGTQTSSYTCNTADGQWVESWSGCSKTAQECACQNPPAGEPSTQNCPSGYTGTQTRTWSASACSWSEWQGTCTPECTDQYGLPSSGTATDTCDGDAISRFSCSSRPGFKGTCTDTYTNGNLSGGGQIVVDWDQVSIDKIQHSTSIDSSLLEKLQTQSSLKGLKMPDGNYAPSFYYTAGNQQQDVYKPIDWKDPCPHGACCCYTCECYQRTPGYGLCPGVYCGGGNTGEVTLERAYHRKVTCCGN